MTRELYWLALTAAMVAVMWIPYGINRIAVLGWWGHFVNPSPDQVPQPAWAQRAKAAHLNNIEGLAIFAPLVLVAHALGISTPITALACAVYFWARLGHYLVYTAGIPVLRTAIWGMGFLAQIALVLAIFRVV